MVKTHLNDLFDNLEPEKGNKLDSEIQINEDEELKELTKIFDILNHKEFNYDQVYFYDKYIENIVSKSYSSKTISKFSTMITNKTINMSHEFFIDKALDSLIQNSNDMNHYLILSQFTNFDISIGHQNKKNIKIDANCLERVGSNMYKGSIIINGDVDGVGTSMKGGKIEVYGNSISDLGWCMRGGEIIINGDINEISTEIVHGNIYHKNKQIVKNGEVLDKSYLRK